MTPRVVLLGKSLLAALVVAAGAMALGVMAAVPVAATVSGTVSASGTGAASGTVTAPANSSPSVDDIVARYVKARGGLERIRAAQTLRQTGRATAGANRSAVVSRELKRPARTRFEFTVQGVTAVYISDGEQGWRVSPFDGDLEPARLSAEVVAEAAEQADIDGPLVEWKPKGHRVELVGREVVNGREAYKLEITLKGGAVLYNYLDVKSFHLIRTDATRTVRGRPVQIQTTFADFKKTGGLLFPRRIEVEAAGRPQRLSVVVDKIEVNPTLSDARFRLPAPLQP